MTQENIRPHLAVYSLFFRFNYKSRVIILLSEVIMKIDEIIKLIENASYKKQVEELKGNIFKTRLL